mgnify:CR=1 FL=1
MTRPIPGPYFIDEDRAAICARGPRTGEVLTLAMFTEWGDEDRATARLMTAAPEMLVALKRLLASTDPGNVDDHDKGCGCVIHEARAAIAKAEGRA